MKRTLVATAAAAAILAGAAAASGPSLLHPASLHANAPAIFRVRFTTTKGPFVVTVHRTWAPRGADRFYNLVHAGTVTSGFATLQHLYHGYGEQPSNAQAQITQHGAAFLEKHFPKLDRILKTRLLG